MNELALFAGAGGGILGGYLLGWRCVCAVEYDHYARSVLMARQNDGCLPPFPIWDDVRTFDGRPWRGRVDVVSGGFPCQDISCAGKGAGITGERSGLWGEMARIIGEVRPRFVWVENSPMLVRRGLAVVLGDLAALGFDARWGVVGAHHAAAPHKRDRIWILAYAQGVESGEPTERQRREDSVRGSSDCGGAAGTRADVPDPGSFRSQPTTQDGELAWGGSGVEGDRAGGDRRQPATDGWWSAEPDVGRVAHGVAARVDRLRCIGNGQVPGVVRFAWNEIGGRA